MPFGNRGEVWIANLGGRASIRPVVVLSVRPQPRERFVMTVVPHTTKVRGVRYEVPLPIGYLKPGAFNAQGVATIGEPDLIRYLGTLATRDVTAVGAAVRLWLAL